MASPSSVNRPRAPRKVLALVLGAGVLPGLVSFAALWWFGDALRVHAPLHEFLELAGSGIALAVAMLLLLRARHEQASPHLLWVAAALVAIGLMDAVHSLIPFGVAFSWSRHASTFVGGALFGLVWLRPPAVAIRRNLLFTVIIGGLAVALQLGIWSRPELLPAPWGPNGYSGATKAVNMLGGVGFLSATLFFLRRHVAQPRTEDLALASHTILFGGAGLLFGFSHTWAADWWVWHGFRLLAFAIVLVAAHQMVVTLYERIERQAYDLDTRVRTRTAQLEAANRMAREEIRHRQQVEESLRASERAARERGAELETVMDVAPIAIWVAHDPQCHRITGNRTANRFYEAERDENVSAGPDVGQHDTTRRFFRNGRELEPHELPMQEAAASGIDIRDSELEVLSPSGRWLTILGSASPLRDDDGRVRGVVAAFVDITDRKRAEAALAESEQRYRTFVEGVPQLMWTSGADGLCDYLSPQWIAYTGIPAEQQLGHGWGKQVHPDDWPRVLARWRDAVATAALFDIEFRIRGADGLYRWFKARAIPVRNEEGDIVKWLGTNTDIDDFKRVESEVRRLNAELEQRVAARTAELQAANSELEAFTYSVAHDLRAPLRHIDGFSRILLEEHSAALSEGAARFLMQIRAGSTRMGRLIDDLLNLARVGRQEIQWQVTGLGAIAEEVIADLKQATPPQRAIEWRVASLPFVECDPGLIRVALENLFSNAIKFTRTRDPAVIEAGVLIDGTDPVVFVRDNGVGFNMRYADKLFGVFQRLHRQEDFEGTGVGLATVQRIVRKHGGRVWAEAELDKGATFYFTLGTRSA